jgi:PTS system nitrogen regulatory IIA component
MERGGIFYDLAASDVDSALEAAVSGISDLPPARQEALLEGLREREAMASTGIGKGVAIPHPRTPLEGVIDPARIFTFFLSEPVDFSAVDDRPVFVMFLMLSPSIETHLHLLSRLSFCVRDERFVAFLRNRPDSDALLSSIAEFEQTLDAAGA